MEKLSRDCDVCHGCVPEESVSCGAPDENELPYILAVDFDGTLVSNKWPEIGTPNWLVVDLVKRLQDNGAKLILWTCRTDDHLENAASFCKNELGIAFDAVNENLPEVMALFGGNPRKVFFHGCLDDRNIGVLEILNHPVMSKGC